MKRSVALFIMQWAVAIVSGVGAARLFVALTHHGILGIPVNVIRTICIAEIVGAVLFLVPRTTRLGGWCLLVVYIVAGVVHVLHGQYDISNLILLGAAVAVVLTKD